MVSQPGLQTTEINILTNISRSKGNQTMRFGQLIEHNRNIFLEKLCAKCGGETIARPFSQKSKLSISLWINSLNFIQFVFVACQIEDYQNVLKLKLQTTCPYLI